VIHSLRSTANQRVLISGAGVAGPALAFWLGRAGFRVTIVERSSALREGGQAVDFRGPVHRAVLERMDIWQAIHEHRTRPSDLCLLGANGKPCARLPEVMLSGDVEILRGDLCRIIYQRTARDTEYRFGDRITRLENREGSVHVEFERGQAEDFELVIGADGLHSGVRALAFLDEARVLRHHGYRIASFALKNLVPEVRGAVCYSEPGRGVCLYGSSAGEARALLVHCAGPLGREERDLGLQKRALAERFLGMGWRVPEILAGLEPATDLYVDAIASVQLDRYANGRIALLGDAAWGGTLGGQGTSLAIVGAYVLAHELSAQSNPALAFARYEATMRPYATRCQAGAARAGAFFAPRTRFGLALRNVFYRALTARCLSGVFERLVKQAASDFTLPEYAS
jgi:2-polyprenyl-6-methoxyphenol hydroxylase-like FAD-dependent oxidoreductase